ncbi:CHASE2 domain-containing protein [Duganella sp. LX20W]|uniref:CHASE2 domain-containing protein n=1 Tax=Rugamonas brunnea TaxID=2758569 RepID=A0A7W2ET02_9BURK|nr:CHASE2 domain-containing protein [Rugamonas brunnea]MBA5638079.1 CHASE2 domain-containing protein [Rugamonas brunnea]
MAAASRPHPSLLRRLRGWLPLREGQAPLYALGLCLTLAVALLSIFQPPPLQQLDLLLYDMMVAGRAAPPPSSAPVVVGIDEDSLAAYGQWPWPRYRLAQLVRQLRQFGATVVVLDLLMPEADRTAPEVITHERQRDLDATATDSSHAPPPTPDSNSQRLANTLAEGASVLAYYLDFSQQGTAAATSAATTTAATTTTTATATATTLATATTTTAAITAASTATAPSAPDGTVVLRADGGRAWHMPRAGRLLRSVPVLTAAASAEGYTNALEDLDGTLRRVPLLLPVAGKERPSLALSALLLTSQDRLLRLGKDGSDFTLYWDRHAIPLDAAGNLLLDYRNASHAYLSARAVLDGKVAPASLRGKIVLIGTWARGLGDWHRTPSGNWLNGLDIHATIIDNVLSDSYISRPDWARGVELTAVLLAGLAGTLMLSQPGYLLSLLAVLAGTGGFYWTARQLLLEMGVHLSPLFPIMALVLITTCLSLLKYGIEARKLHARTQDLYEAQDEIIFSLSVLAESRDKDTGQHILRTQRYVEILARELATTPAYAHLTPSDIELYAKSAPLHDIGKVGIPDSILQKPGKLTPEEYTIMKTHPLIGAATLARIIVGHGHPEKRHFLNYAREMIEAHHERWDGGGYPHGLRGAAIPLAGRLMALADVYDALISKRVYKRGYSHAEVCAYIAEQSGTQFDPDLVAAFQRRHEEFFQVAQEHADVTSADGDVSAA